MHPWENCLKSTLGTLALGIAFLIAQPINVIATDTIDPATQPHLKSWSNIIPAAKRFVVLADFNNEAVSDRETGLVWELSPSAIRMNWSDSVSTCWQENIGGRGGWHLATIEELSTLVHRTGNPPVVSASTGKVDTNEEFPTHNINLT